MTSGYDTIHFWVNRSLPDKVELENGSIRIFENGRSRNGRIKNLRINSYPHGVSIKGSLAQFFLRSNCFPFNLADTKQAIQELESRLEISLQDAKVTRLDFGVNLQMDFPVESYFQYLGECKYLNRLRQPKSLYYQNGIRKVRIYNKAEQARSKKLIIPESWEGLNVMRIELEQLSKELKKTSINLTCSDILKESFFQATKSKFMFQYSEIEKLYPFRMNYNDIKTEGDFMKQLSAYAIDAIGMEDILSMINDVKSIGGLANPENYSRLKKRVKSISKGCIIRKGASLIDELDSKVQCIL